MRYRYIALLLMALLFLWCTADNAWASDNVKLLKAEVLGTPLKIIAIDLGNPRVKISLALCEKFPRGSESFSRIVERTRPAAAITGTFFDVRTRRPVGDLVENGNLRYFGGFGTALAVTPANDVSLHRVPRGRHIHWWNAETVIMTGPTLVHRGAVVLDPRSEGFRSGLLRKAARAAVGVTGKKKMLFVATGDAITLGTLARIMRSLGCRDAVNLDGGSSTALAYRGKVLIAPGRGLVNLITCHEDVPPEERYIYPGLPYDYKALQRGIDEREAAEAMRAKGSREAALAHARRAFLAAPWEHTFRNLYHQCKEEIGEAYGSLEKLLLPDVILKEPQNEISRLLRKKALPSKLGMTGAALLPPPIDKGADSFRSDHDAWRALLEHSCPMGSAESLACMIDKVIQYGLSFSPALDGKLYIQVKMPAGPFDDRTVRLGRFTMALPESWVTEISPRDGAVAAWHRSGKALVLLREFNVPERFSLFHFASLFGEHTGLGLGTTLIRSEKGASLLDQEWKRIRCGVELALLSRFIRVGRTLYVVSLAGEGRDLLIRERDAIRFSW